MPNDIVFCLNRAMLRPLIAAMNSIVANASAPERLRFNIAVPPVAAQVDAFTQEIDHAFPDRTFEARITGVTVPERISDYMIARSGAKITASGGLALNYARFDIHNVFDDLGRYIYLDADLIVLDDIETAIDALKPGARLAAVPQLFTGLLYFRNPIKGFREGIEMLRPFNAGVYVTDATLWTDELMATLYGYLDWDKAEGYRLFSLHTEPLMNLLFKDYQHLPVRWNRSGFGNHPALARLLKRPVKDIGILHWSGGHKKPWKDTETVFADLWWQYDKGPLSTA